MLFAVCLLDRLRVFLKGINGVYSKFTSISMMTGNEIVHEPCQTLFSESTNVNYAVIILNCPVGFMTHPSVLMNLWTKAKVRITVDGGTDRWVTWLKNNKYAVEDVLHPDLITGDLDSMCKETLTYFHTKDVTVIKTPDQNRTDFTKALYELDHYCHGKDFKIDQVYVLADTCGRLDQIIGNLHTLYLARDILPACKIYQVASNSISWLLSPGQHTVDVPAHLRNAQEWCALVPISCDCLVSTAGLKWNLDNTVLKFGKFISTSNTYSGSPTVTVNTDQPILWSMGIAELL